ncbi:MAG: hypothetical protein NT013_15750, partial [Planctomycetia bacterium]|nr:hypothetical protein [Planctomycetia bacterium]
KRKVLVHRWDSIPKRIFPKHPNANLPAMFSSTSLLFRILAFEIHDRRQLLLIVIWRERKSANIYFQGLVATRDPRITKAKLAESVEK